MPARGQTTVTFNDAYFDRILKTAAVENLTRAAAERALGVAKANAPVDTGSYRDQLRVQRRVSGSRVVVRVVGDDPKTLLIESKTGNLARALKAARG